jgi:hypothetical protein
MIALLAAWGVAPAKASQPTEYEVKAAFLFNLVQFVQWPEQAFARPDSAFCIGVLGPNPFEGKLAAIVRGESFHGHPMVVRQSFRLADLLDCQVVFVTTSERDHVDFILHALEGRPVLTVGELPDFGRRGGIVNFYLEGQKVRFEINRAAAQHHQLRLASQVLVLARLVGPQPQETR